MLSDSTWGSLNHSRYIAYETRITYIVTFNL